MKSIPNISLYHGYTSTSGSLYTGPFAAGKFKAPSLSVSQDLTIAKSISPRSKNILSSKPSEAATDRAQTEQDRPLESPPAVPRVKVQRFRTLSDPKLGQISAISSRCSKVPTLSDRVDKESTKAAPPLGDYLKFLNFNSNSSDLKSFREKMSLSRNHFKSFGDISSLPFSPNQKIATTLLADTKLSPNSKRLRPTVPSLAFNLQQSPNHSPIPTLSKITSPVHSPRRRVISPKSLEDQSPALLAKQASRRKLLTLIMDDNAQARELSEEIEKNYQLFEETASKSKEIKLQFTLLLKKVGLLQTFETKNSKINPLVHRIYNDMLEEPESTKSPSLKMDYSPRKMLRNMSMPKFQTKGRLIKAKYEAYKTVNETLEDMLLQYKLHNLKRLENTLLQAHESLVFKKKKMLSQLEMNDYDTFCRVKKNFEQIGDVPAAYYSEYVEEVERLQLRYGETLKIDESQKIVNKGLGEILQKWTNKVQ